MYEKQLKEKNNRYCKKCGKELGYFEAKTKKRSFTTNCHSTEPLVFCDSKYYRIICIDCFVNEHKRMPKVGSLSYDFEHLLGIPYDIIKNFSKKCSCTIENFIRIHSETEGKKKWDEYRNRQAETNTFEYKNKKYNMTLDEFKEYNKKRSTTLKNLIDRHGETEGKKKWDEYRNRQAYAGCKLEYFVEKYGEEEGKKKFEDVNAKKKHTLDVFIDRYGEEEGLQRFKNYISNSYSFYSLNSQELFDMIYNELPNELKEKTYYATLNSEFGQYDKKLKKFYKYDFAISSLNFILEYNGDLYHANPKKFKATDCPNPHKKSLTAEEIWESDKNKKECIETQMGYSVYYVWESEFLENKEKTLKNIMGTINEIYKNTR